MLIDQNHRPANGAARPALCAYHADRLRATIPPSIRKSSPPSFSTTSTVSPPPMRSISSSAISSDSWLASASPARRHRLAYISQLILTSQTAMARERAAEEEAVEKGEHDRLIAGLRQASRELASRRNQQSAGASAEPVKDDPQRAA